MIMPRTPKKKAEDDDPTWAADQRVREYYYDDAHGYQTFDPDDATVIYTIGHSTRDLDDFIGLLAANEIELVADVRSLPGSRKFPQYNKEELEKSLPASGIEYRHLHELGGRRRANKASQNTGWRNKVYQGYADYMETAVFADGIKQLLAVAEDERTAIMC